MPIYCYSCSECGSRKEEYLAMNQRNQKIYCSICKKPMIRLVGKGSGFYLKGKGFYKEGWSYSKGDEK